MKSPQFLLVFLFSLFCTSSFATTIGSLSEGPPRFSGKAIPAETYADVQTKRLAHARVVWLNFDWLKEHDITFPEQGLTPEFEQEVLDAFAYSIPRASDDPSLFQDKSKTFYADRYGGMGIGENFGSGRAGSAGAVQIKGIGITPLVSEKTSTDHAHGGASFEESIREAIWGEINNQDLPHGSNRVIAIIDSGTFTDWDSGGREKRALIVREDPIRPGQLLLPSAQTPTPEQEARIRRAVKNAGNTFAEVVPESKAVGAALVSEGYLAYVKRIAEQYAATYAKRIFHGATSESNIDLRGKLLDFGTESSLRSYQSIMILDDNDPFGDTQEFKKVLVANVINGIREYSEAAQKLPTAKEANKLFSQMYRQALRFEMLKLTGAPPELLSDILSNKEVQEFADQLILFTEAEFKTGGDNLIKMDRDVPHTVKPTQLPAILANIQHTEYAAPYQKFIAQLEIAAEAHGIQKENLRTYMNYQLPIINRSLDSLMRPGLIWEDILLIGQYMNDGNRSPIWNWIDQQIENGVREKRSAFHYELVLESHADHLKGVEWQKIFNLKTGEYQNEMTPVAQRTALIVPEVHDCNADLKGIKP